MDDTGRYPDGLLYHPEHQWAAVDGSRATLGITWYAQQALGEVVFVDVPGLDVEVVAGQPYAQVESVKTISDVFAPLSGRVTEVNGAVEERPHAVNEDPYGQGWLVRIAVADPTEQSVLLLAGGYRRMLEEQ